MAKQDIVRRPAACPGFNGVILSVAKDQVKWVMIRRYAQNDSGMTSKESCVEACWHNKGEDAK